MIGQLLDSQGRNNKIENTLTGLRITAFAVNIFFTGMLAQLVERSPVKAMVVGSSPAHPERPSLLERASRTLVSSRTESLSA